jgi:hypothetical protein
MRSAFAERHDPASEYKRNTLDDVSVRHRNADER